MVIGWVKGVAGGATGAVGLGATTGAIGATGGKGLGATEGAGLAPAALAAAALAAATLIAAAVEAEPDEPLSLGISQPIRSQRELCEIWILPSSVH